MKYAVLRTLLVGACVIGIASYPQSQSNVDWPVGLIIGGLSSLVFFAWLAGVRSSGEVDFSKPYSWTTPFYPMRRYPLRYLFVASLSLIAGGAATMVLDLFRPNAREGFGAVFLLWGLCIAGTLQIWIKCFANRTTHRNGMKS